MRPAPAHTDLHTYGPHLFGTVLQLVQYLVLFNTTEYFFSFFLSIFTLKYQYLVVYGSFNYYLGLKYQYSIIKGSLVLENRIFKKLILQFGT